MGGRLFVPLEGENSDRQNAIRSPGHNSVYHDPETDRWFILHHTRFAANSRYIVQVRELFFNDADWPMIAPTRYVPGAEEQAEVKLEGKFKLLRHERDINLVEHLSVATEFGADGSIAGDASGSFELGEGGKIVLSVDGVDYSGRCYVGYDETQDEFVTCITALSAGGEALWAMRATGQD